jgi:hypothetical protein
MLMPSLPRGRSQKRCFQSLGQRKEPHCFFVLTILLIRECGVPMRVELGGFQGALCANITNRRVSWPFGELTSRFEWRQHGTA